MNENACQDNYEFLDCGHLKRLERVSGCTFLRQAPQADFPPSLKELWSSPDYEYRIESKGFSWNMTPREDEALPDFCSGSLVMEIRLSENGQIGVYPEQQNNWDWLGAFISETENPLRILNGFAYTGASTIVCAQALKGRADSEICHLDSSNSAVNWARTNRGKSGLPEDSIRFIVDDISRFLDREIRRGNRYDGLILDPPAFGRAKGGVTWILKRDLPSLMDRCRQVLVPEPSFFLLSCHDPEISKADLASALAGTIGRNRSEIETVDLILSSKNGNSLPNGIAARWSRKY
jgi:23S rRNA (cytosine1962-C5)-methyltransferase